MEQHIISIEEQIINIEEQIFSVGKQIEEHIISIEEPIINIEEQIIYVEEQIISTEEQIINIEEQIVGINEQIIYVEEHSARLKERLMLLLPREEVKREHSSFSASSEILLLECSSGQQTEDGDQNLHERQETAAFSVAAHPLSQISCFFVARGRSEDLAELRAGRFVSN